jgi:hypothetical protein
LVPSISKVYSKPTSRSFLASSPLFLSLVSVLPTVSRAFRLGISNFQERSANHAHVIDRDVETRLMRCQLGLFAGKADFTFLRTRLLLLPLRWFA